NRRAEEGCRHEHQIRGVVLHGDANGAAAIAWRRRWKRGWGRTGASSWIPGRSDRCGQSRRRWIDQPEGGKRIVLERIVTGILLSPMLRVSRACAAPSDI